MPQIRSRYSLFVFAVLAVGACGEGQTGGDAGGGASGGGAGTTSTGGASGANMMGGTGGATTGGSSGAGAPTGGSAGNGATSGTAGAGGSNAGGEAGTLVGGAGMGGATAGAAGAGVAGGGANPGGAAGTAGAAGTGGGPPDTSKSWTIVSPSNLVRATVELADKGGTSGYPAGVRLYYTVQAGGPSAYTTVLEDSPLGITRSDQGFVDALALDTAGPTTVVDETYTMLTGKKSSIRNHANQRVLSFNGGTSKVELVLRAYDGGFAFRYRFPETNSTQRTVTGETTGFKIPANSRAWLLPYDVAGEYTPAYESYWRNDVAVGTQSPTGPGWCLPALFRTPSNHWVLLHDTDVNGSYFAAHLAPTASNNVYRIDMPEANEGESQGAVNPSSALPWATAWRMVATGSLATIVESTMATDLAAPSALTDVSWIRPGRASWSWWTADGNPTSYNANTPFVDLAQTMTWEYSLIDHGWHQMGNGGTWQNLVTYASARNVGLMVWYNSGGNHNRVGLTPRDRMNVAATRRSELQSISQAGIKGIKVDFFHSDKPWMMQYYLDILRDAAEFRLLVNFHGSTIPRGWQRTYPNLMTVEAVRGAEWYKYEAGYPADAARRNTILVFARNVVSSMDYTPVTFTNHANAHLTTYGHELALSVVFESGIQHFADRVSGYTSLAAGPRSFLQQVPSTWDETRFVEGTPGQHVVLARRKGTTWYLAGIAGDTQARNLMLNLGFLGAGTYTATIIADGSSDTTFSERSAQVGATSPLAVSLRARGGFVARITPG
jgi:alpha-glucosidase